MTTIQIKVKRPENPMEAFRNALRAIPMGSTQDSAIRPDGDDNIVEIRHRRKDAAYEAAAIFIENFNGEVITSSEITGKKVIELM